MTNITEKITTELELLNRISDPEGKKTNLILNICVQTSKT